MNPTLTIDLAGVVRESIVDGPGIRFAVFCQGCPHACPGCHNPETHPFGVGKPTEVGKILFEMDKDPLLDGVTLSGGEPFCQPEAMASLAEGVKERGLSVFVFTGYRWEELLEMAQKDPFVDRLLLHCDQIVEGRFLLAERDLSLRFRGSRNQRILDVQASLKEGRPVLVHEYMEGEA